MQNSPHAPESQSLRWYQGLDRYCWIVLTIAALGWLFDTMDMNLFNLVRVPSLTTLLKADYPDAAALDAAVKSTGGLVTAIFVLGWAVGGFIFGILGDRLGRTRTMILTILIYAVFTGLSGLATSWQMYAVMRFMTAMGVGGEWAAGAALVAETFPERSRAMALGVLQALSTVGNMIACVITLFISTYGTLAEHWRWAYFIGAAPALLVLWIRRSVKEPPQWHEARLSATAGRELGKIKDLFNTPTLLRNTIAGMLLGTAGVGALWGIAFFSPDLMRSELEAGGVENPGWYLSIEFLVQMAGAFVGAMLFAPMAQRIGRRATFAIWFALAWISVPIFFWGIQGTGADAFNRSLILGPILGCCTFAPFAGYTVYFPELFPTRLRSTGCGFCYNASRVLAAGAPFALGGLSTSLGGRAQAATVVSFVLLFGFVGAFIGPETRGKALPEDADLDPALLDDAEAVPAE